MDSENRILIVTVTLFGYFWSLVFFKVICFMFIFLYRCISSSTHPLLGTCFFLWNDFFFQIESLIYLYLILCIFCKLDTVWILLLPILLFHIMTSNIVVTIVSFYYSMICFWFTKAVQLSSFCLSIAFSHRMHRHIVHMDLQYFTSRLFLNAFCLSFLYRSLSFLDFFSNSVRFYFLLLLLQLLSIVYCFQRIFLEKNYFVICMYPCSCIPVNMWMLKIVMEFIVAPFYWYSLF